VVATPTLVLGTGSGRTAAITPLRRLSGDRSHSSRARGSYRTVAPSFIHGGPICCHRHRRKVATASPVSAATSNSVRSRLGHDHSSIRRTALAKRASSVIVTIQWGNVAANYLGCPKETVARTRIVVIVCTSGCRVCGTAKGLTEYWLNRAIALHHQAFLTPALAERAAGTLVVQPWDAATGGTSHGTGSRSQEARQDT
jgi:hypothetical protein